MRTSCGKNVKASGLIGAYHEGAAWRLAVVCDGDERFVAQSLQS